MATSTTAEIWLQRERALQFAVHVADDWRIDRRAAVDSSGRRRRLRAAPDDVKVRTRAQQHLDVHLKVHIVYPWIPRQQKDLRQE